MAIGALLALIICAHLFSAAQTPSADALEGAATGGGEKKVRRPAVAGAFYPADPRELRSAVEGHLSKARPRVPDSLKERRPIALIVPHAGYLYSGQTAAYAYKLLQGKDKPSRVVLLGPSHRVYLGEAVSVPPFTHYRTPLGEIAVDMEARDRLLRPPLCVSNPGGHIGEHSLEVQLPFLQVVWEEAPPILPVVVGGPRGEALKQLADGIRNVVDEDTLIVASSDFTHYGPRFMFSPFKGSRGKELAEKIRQLDMGAVEYIRKLDPEGLLKYCDRTGATICGRFPIALMLAALSGSEKLEAVHLHYASSADVTGDCNDSVSYCAIAFYRAGPEEEAGAQEKS